MASMSDSQEAHGDQQPAEGTAKRISSVFMATNRENFKSEYIQCSIIGQGGFGKVFAGHRAADFLPNINGELYMVPKEVLLMLIAARGPESKGKSAVITLLEWCDLGEQIVLVMERPPGCTTLLNHMAHCPLHDALLKDIMRQLVDAVIHMHSVGVFHRDIKCENILIEAGEELDNLRIRVIDFGSGYLTFEKPCSLSGIVSYQPPKLNKQMIYEGGPTTVWQLGSVLYNLLVRDKRFNTQMFLLDEALFLSDLKDLNVTKDCLNFLKTCLNINAEKRATLKELTMHPWFD